MSEKQHYITFTNGESIAFDDYFRSNFSKFVAFTASYLLDTVAGEDVVQDAFISAWQAPDGAFDSELSLTAYMYRVSRNHALNLLKHRDIQTKYSARIYHELETENFLLRNVWDEETRYLLYKAIDTLSPQCRAVIQLHLAGKKNQEIADYMDISVVTVKSHKMLAYRQLRNILARLFLLLSLPLLS